MILCYEQTLEDLGFSLFLRWSDVFIKFMLMESFDARDINKGLCSEHWRNWEDL